MTIQFVCEHCGKVFDNEIECRQHEYEHALNEGFEKIKDELFFYDESHNEMDVVRTLREGRHDWVFYIQINSTDALEWVVERFHEEGVDSEGLDGCGLYGYDFLDMGEMWIDILSIKEKVDLTLNELGW